MSENEFTCSPPYPGPTTTREHLWDMLQDLRGWVIEQTSHLNGKVDPELFSQLDFPPELDDVISWNQVSVSAMSSTWHHMRHIREWWDHVLRTHEDSWECEACCKLRAELVKSALGCLGHALILPEHYEMLQEREHKKMRDTQAKLDKLIQSVHSDDEDPDESSFDAYPEPG